MSSETLINVRVKYLRFDIICFSLRLVQASNLLSLQDLSHENASRTFPPESSIMFVINFVLKFMNVQRVFKFMRLCESRVSLKGALVAF